ncbi:hypothetical protein DKP78_15120, partial [Enterococcus faecium]
RSQMIQITKNQLNKFDNYIYYMLLKTLKKKSKKRQKVVNSFYTINIYIHTSPVNQEREEHQTMDSSQGCCRHSQRAQWHSQSVRDSVEPSAVSPLQQMGSSVLN